jgi:hypothetical protein
MKTTLEIAVNAAQIVARLNSVRMKSSTTARKLFNLKKLLEPNFEFYAEEEKKLIDALGGTVAEDGSILFADQQEGLTKLQEGRKELLSSECDIPIDTPILFRDAEGLQVSGREIEILQGLAEFTE